MADKILSSVDNWENKGGAVKPRLPMDSGLRPRLPRLSHRSTKASQDTAAGCRARAAADLLTAATMDTENGRLKLEHSAISWTVRGEMLSRLEIGRRTRTGSAKPAELRAG